MCVCVCGAASGTRPTLRLLEVAEDAAAAEGVEALDDRARVLVVPHAQRAHEVRVEDPRLERDDAIRPHRGHVRIVVVLVVRRPRVRRPAAAAAAAAVGRVGGGLGGRLGRRRRRLGRRLGGGVGGLHLGRPLGLELLLDESLEVERLERLARVGVGGLGEHELVHVEHLRRDRRKRPLVVVVVRALALEDLLRDADAERVVLRVLVARGVDRDRDGELARRQRLGVRRHELVRPQAVDEHLELRARPARRRRAAGRLLLGRRHQFTEGLPRRGGRRRATQTRAPRRRRGRR
jgi:hypothetical protein